MTESWKTARDEYNAAEIPAELDGRVRAGIAEGRRRRNRRMALRRTVSGLAACLVLLFGGLNLFPTFASAAADVPVLGGLFRVMTVRGYRSENEDRTLTVSEPAVSGGGAFEKRINEEIQERVDAETAKGEKTVKEYKDAFLSTGGTEAEWAAHDNRVSVTYEVKSETDSVVSFVVRAQTSTSVGYESDAYYNLDVKNDRELTLKDLLGDDWVALCNRSVKAQMAASKDPGVFFTADQGGFTTVDADTGFYINKAGNPVVVFPAYAVAIGSEGPVEFEIVK